MEIAETEAVKFLGTFKIWVFFGQIDGLFGKKLEFFSKSLKWQICRRKRIKWFYFSKLSASVFMRFFWQKNQESLNVGKIRNYDERVLFREKKRFHLFKRLLYKNEKAQNMPVVGPSCWEKPVKLGLLCWSSMPAFWSRDNVWLW